MAELVKCLGSHTLSVEDMLRMFKDADVALEERRAALADTVALRAKDVQAALAMSLGCGLSAEQRAAAEKVWGGGEGHAMHAYLPALCTFDLV